MNDQAIKFRLGIFVLSAAILLGILIVLFGEFPAIFTRHIPYTVKFPAAPGLEPESPVRKSGVRIGEVASLSLDSDSGEVTVHIAVDAKYQLRVGDQPVLARSLMLGDTALNFVPVPQADRTPAPANHEFKGEPAPDLLGQASDLVPAALEAIQDFRTTAKSINEFMPQLRRTTDEIQVAARNFGKAAERVDVVIQTNEQAVAGGIEQFTKAMSRVSDILTQENQRNLSASLKNIRTATDRLDNTMRNADLLLTESRQTLKTFGTRIESVGQSAEDVLKESRTTIKHLNDSLTKTDEVLINVQKATKPLADRSETVMKNLEEGTARFNQFSKNLVEGEGSFRRLMDDPDLYNNFNELAIKLNQSMRQVDRILQDFQVFADKIARHPELLGVRGAVSPSSGIKDAPSTIRPMAPRGPGK